MPRRNRSRHLRELSDQRLAAPHAVDATRPLVGPAHPSRTTVDRCHRHGPIWPLAVTASPHIFLKSHTRDEYGAWHLGLKVEASEETKSRYGFAFGDLRRLHRSGLIACHFRAAEFDHKQIELAAHDLLQLLDDKRR